MRKFYFENETGSRIDLNSQSDIFLAEPSGLGAEFDSEYSDSINGFFIESEYAHAMSDISGDLYFISDPYTLFKKLSDFVHGASTLYFVYSPNESTSYYKRVKVKSLSKGQLEKTGVLVSSMSLDGLTPWYIPTPVELEWGGEQEFVRFCFGAFNTSTMTKSGGEELLADPTDSSAPHLMKDSLAAFETYVPASAQMEGALKVTIKGMVKNPTLSLVGESTGKTYGSMTLSNYTLESGSSITLCSDYLNSYVSKTDSSGNTTDLIPSLNLNEDFFIRIPTAERCKLRLTYSEFSGASASAELYYYYRSV